MLASSARIQSSRSQSRKSPGGGPPALLTRMSGSGQAASAAAAAGLGGDVARRPPSPRRRSRCGSRPPSLQRFRRARGDRHRHAFARQRHRAGPAQAPCSPRRRSPACPSIPYPSRQLLINGCSAARQASGIGAGRRVAAATQTCTMKPSADARSSSLAEHADLVAGPSCRRAGPPACPAVDPVRERHLARGSGSRSRPRPGSDRRRSRSGCRVRTRNCAHRGVEQAVVVRRCSRGRTRRCPSSAGDRQEAAVVGAGAGPGRAGSAHRRDHGHPGAARARGRAMRHCPHRRGPRWPRARCPLPPTRS